jgi:hypothetical protein
MADGDPVLLEELEGDRRTLVLGGPDLPAVLTQGASLRSVRTRYPGNGRVSTQILGTEEDDIEVEGQFRDAWVAQTGWASAQYATLIALFRGRRLIQLAWGTSLVVRGYIGRVSRTIERDAVVGYRLTFQADEADDPAAVAPVPQRQPQSREVRSALDLLSDALDVAESAARVLTVLDAVT